MELNRTLLSIILAVQDCRQFELSKSLLGKCKNKYSDDVNYDWYVNVGKFFFSIDNTLIKKAGIKKNQTTFERILSCSLPEEVFDTEYCDLGKFRVFI